MGHDILLIEHSGECLLMEISQRQFLPLPQNVSVMHYAFNIRVPLSIDFDGHTTGVRCL